MKSFRADTRRNSRNLVVPVCPIDGRILDYASAMDEDGDGNVCLDEWYICPACGNHYDSPPNSKTEKTE